MARWNIQIDNELLRSEVRRWAQDHGWTVAKAAQYALRLAMGHDQPKEPPDPILLEDIEELNCRRYDDYRKLARKGEPAPDGAEKWLQAVYGIGWGEIAL